MPHKEYKTALFIFRRDLRLQDNTALIEATRMAEKVVTCFILDPRQLSTKNPYRSANAIQFMFESLRDLDKQLQAKKGKLFLFEGTAQSVVKKLLADKAFDALFLNADYTPFSIERDTAIEKLCKKKEIAFHAYHDALLTAPEDVLSKSKTPYKVFTPFFRTASKLGVTEPQKLARASFASSMKLGVKTVPLSALTIKNENKDIAQCGGRTHGLKILKNLGAFKEYKKTRNFPAIETTRLSAHNKFGTISIREVYHAMRDKLGARSDLPRQLYWRDFFTHVVFHFPHVLGKPFRKEFGSISWSYSKKNFELWCQGNTGFPIVDAGMRELNATGYMHNRVRMIVASFLVKNLHIDWRWGEQYFAQQLVDYDPAVNNGNWQWVASTGCDAQPYFRIFNPWTQSKRFDPECEYITMWVPELENLEPTIIHKWYKYAGEHADIDYPESMVDHAQTSREAKEMFKKAAGKK